jgi:Domain of unknown function (DUF4388)
MTLFATSDDAHGPDAPALRVTDGTFTLDELLRFAAATRRATTVHVDGTRAGRVVFDDGCIVGADVAGSPDTAAVVGRRAPDGDVHAVAVAALDHVVDVLLELEVESARTRSFELVPGVAQPALAGVALAVDEVLATKTARLREWKEIVAGLPAAGASLRRATVLDHPVTLDPDDWLVVAALADESSVARLTRTSGIGAFATCRSVRRLLDAGAVVVVEAEPWPDGREGGAERVVDTVRCEARPWPDGREGGAERAMDKGTSS